MSIGEYEREYWVCEDEGSPKRITSRKELRAGDVVSLGRGSYEILDSVTIGGRVQLQVTMV